MRYNEIINEAIIKVNPYLEKAPIIVLVNPSRAALINLYKKSEYKELRGLYSEGKLYFWDAAKLIHFPMARELGIPYYDGMRLNFSTFTDKNGDRRYHLFHDEAIQGILEDVPYIIRNFDYDPEGYGHFYLKK